MTDRHLRGDAATFDSEPEPLSYVPRSFAISDEDAFELVEQVGAGHLVTSGPSGLASTFLPLLVDREHGLLRGHLARANPHQRAIGVTGVPGLVIVTGADGYVSPSWYPSKHDHGKVVPTWNYELVHLHGTVRVIDDDTTVERIVRDLTELHETGRAAPWSVDDAPADYLDGLRRAIVGVEMSIASITGKRKMSQNRPAADVAGVVSSQASDTATDTGGPAMTEALRRANPTVAG